jgi:hypothetical protein
MLTFRYLNTLRTDQYFFLYIYHKSLIQSSHFFLTSSPEDQSKKCSMYCVIKCVKTKRVLKRKFASSAFHNCNAKMQKTQICVTGPQCVKSNLQFYNSPVAETICVITFFRIKKKLHQKCMKCSKHLSVRMPWGEQSQWCFMIQMWEIHLKMVNINISPITVAQKKMWRKIAKSSTKTSKIAFCRSLTGYISPMEHVSEV